jgi:HEAT repeat protein
MLLALSRPPNPLGIRAFAITALAKSARFGGETLTEARRLLDGYLAEDTDDAVRDMAARMLGWLPADYASTARLAAAASRDASWRVRYSAVESLAALGEKEAVRAATGDADERVAERARELLER